MSTINFPDNPTSGDLYSFGGKTWQWNGNYWGVYSSGITITDITYSSTTGNLNITKSDASSLTAGTWTYIYDGSYNTTSRQITLSANTGGTITISNLDYNGVTDLNYDIPTRILSISRPSGPDSVDLSSLIGNLIYSGSYNSNTGVVTFYPVSGDPFNVPGFLTGYTNTYTTGFTYNPDSGLIQFNRTDLQNAYSGFTAYVVSGDSNYLVKYNSTGTTESIIYDNGTNVGINTISPSYLLDVNGNTRFRNFVGIGPSGTSSTYGLWNSLPFSGSSSTFYGISNDSLISSATTNAISYHSTLGLNDFSVTNANITHYLADQKTFTTNRGITNHIGYRVSSLLTGTTVYGFYGEVAGTGTTRWNLYMPGSANNFLQGKLLVGNSGASVANATFEKPISTTNGVTSLFQAGSTQGTIVTAYGIRNQLIMSASSTANTYIHISAAQGNIGSGAVLGTQYGFAVGSDFTSGSTNIAFYSAVNSASTQNWNLYILGTAPNYIAGRIGFGSTSFQNMNMRLQRNIDGGSAAYAVFQAGFVQSPVQAGYGFNNTLNAGSTNTLSNYYHFNAINSSTDTITGMSGNHGYYAHANLVYTGATNNYGFYGNLASGSSTSQNWNLFMNGTAHNFMRGRLGIGDSSIGAYSLRVSNNASPDSGTIYYGISHDGIVSRSLVSMYGIANNYSMAANTTASTYTNFFASQGSWGAGSRVSEVNGFQVRSNFLSGDTIYGFRGEVVSSSTRWNIYMNGTAPNYLAGDLRIGSLTNSGYKLDVVGTGRTSGLIVSNIVGVGTTSPDSTLHVHNASAGSVTPIGGTVATIENNTTNYLSMLAPDANYSGIVFGSPSDSFGAYIRWRQTDGFLDIATADFGDYIRLIAGNDNLKAYLTTNGFGVNTQPVASAALEISATTQGFLPPRMTNAQITSIASPATGLMAYSTTDNLIVYYNGNNWMKITGVTTL